MDYEDKYEELRDKYLILEDKYNKLLLDYHNLDKYHCDNILTSGDKNRYISIIKDFFNFLSKNNLFLRIVDDFKLRTFELSNGLKVKFTTDGVENEEILFESIKSLRDNSIPYELFDSIGMIFKAQRYHLG